MRTMIFDDEKNKFQKIVNDIWYDYIYDVADYIETKYYNVKYGIPNIIKYFDVIGSDRPGDYIFITELLQRKLELMEHSHRNYSGHVGADKEADDMKKCINALKRINKQDYHKYIDTKSYDCGGNGIVDEETGEFKGENVKTEEDKKKFKKDVQKVSQKENELEKQDIDYVFNLMSKKLRSWGD